MSGSPDSFKRVTQEAGNDLIGLVYAVGTINLKSFRRFEGRGFFK